MENDVNLLSFRVSSEEISLKSKNPRVVHVLLLFIQFWLPVTSFPFSFRSCLKTTLIYPPDSYRKHLLEDSDTQVVRPRVVHVLLLLIRFWLPVTSFPFCSLHPHHLPKRHMLSIHVWASSSFVFIIVLVWHPHPSSLAFFYSAANKHPCRSLSFSLESFITLTLVYKYSL